MLNDHFGIVTEAYLVAARGDRYSEESAELASYREAATDESLAEDVRDRAGKIVEIAGHIVLRDRLPSLTYLVNKLELASRFES